MQQRPTTPQDQIARFATTDPDINSNIRPTASRFGLAIDAVGKDKSFAADGVSKYLRTLADSFELFAVQEPANGLLDAKVLAALEIYRPYFDEYCQLLGLIARYEGSIDFSEPLIDFFGSVLTNKRVASEKTLQAYLWTDGYRFILRELFLTTVAILLRNEKYALIRELLEARYINDVQHGDGSTFVAFDGYAKTLDEFRNRRLQLQRMSVSVDLFRERMATSECDFESIMQADFILCLRSLLHGQDFFARWYPRSLVFAEQFAGSGFDLFVTGADPRRFGPLQSMLGVEDRMHMIRQFDYVHSAWQLGDWELAGLPLDFHAFMGLRNAALAN